jgi:hypothetical protein
VGFSHHAVLELLFLVIGSSVGSFLNVCAYRIPLGQSLLWPRSRCPRCLTAICARDNVPVLGWIFRRGRCRACEGAISARYPVIELVTGLSFAGVYLAWVSFASTDVWEQNGVPGVVLRLLCFWSLIAIAAVLALVVYDWRGMVNSLRSRVVPTSDPASDHLFERAAEREIGSLPIATAALAPSPMAVRHQNVGQGPNRRPELTAETRRSGCADFGRCSNPATRLNGAAPREPPRIRSPN